MYLCLKCTSDSRNCLITHVDHSLQTKKEYKNLKEQEILVKPNQQLADKLHKNVIRKFPKRNIY